MFPTVHSLFYHHRVVQVCSTLLVFVSSIAALGVESSPSFAIFVLSSMSSPDFLSGLVLSPFLSGDASAFLFFDCEGDGAVADGEANADPEVRKLNADEDGLPPLVLSIPDEVRLPVADLTVGAIAVTGGRLLNCLNWD